jgi:hypothetical protein
LAEKQIINRIAHGLYHHPRKHPRLGKLSPTPEAIATALAGRAGARLLPSGAYAANILGLSQQVPARITFLTDAPSKKVKIGNQLIELKHTAVRNMATANRVSGLVIQALKYLGKNNITPHVIAALRDTLSSRDKTKLLQDSAATAAWIANHMREIAADSEPQRG